MLPLLISRLMCPGEQRVVQIGRIVVERVG